MTESQIIQILLDAPVDKEYYKAPEEADYYLPPGRKPYDREELNPAEDKIDLGPPTLRNEQLVRQKFAIEEFLRTMRQQVSFNDVTSKIGPQHTIKPAIKNAFFVKEQRIANPDFVEPDEDQEKDKETARFVVDYLQKYKENPTFIEESNEAHGKSQELRLMEKIPLPYFARQKLAHLRKLLDSAARKQKEAEDRAKGGKKKAHSAAPIEKKPLKLKKKPKYRNDQKMIKTIDPNQPFFKRDIRKEHNNYANKLLHQKLLQSELTLRQIKSGRTIFDSEAMKHQYSNPFFKNVDMHEKLLSFLDKRKPKLSPNPNINTHEADTVSLPGNLARSQASWFKSPQSVLNDQSQQQFYSPTAGAAAGVKSPFSGRKRLMENSEDGLTAMEHSMNQTAFNFASLTADNRRLSQVEMNPSPTTALFGERPKEDKKNKMLTMNITQATQSHYPTVAQDDQLSEKLRNIHRRGSFATDMPGVPIGNASDSTQLPQVPQSYLTINNTPAGHRNRALRTVGSSFISQSSIDPNKMLPPCSLTMREGAKKTKKQLKFPMSPAFVNIYKMNRDIKVPKVQDFCMEKNIPFNSEEHNFYKLKQSQIRFKEFKSSLNSCYETARPDDVDTSLIILADSSNKEDVKAAAPPLNKMTESYGDARLYVPNVYLNAHKKLQLSLKQQQGKPVGKKKIVSKIASQSPTRKVGRKQQQKQGKAPDTYGQLYDALEGAHEMSRKNMLKAFHSSERTKGDIMGTLEEKLINPTLVQPSKQLKLVQSSVESLMSSISSREEEGFSPLRTTKEQDRRAAAQYEQNQQLQLQAQGQLPQAANEQTEKRKGANNKRDPIRKILRANHKCFKFQRNMNDLLIKILHRYELDKPILMRDKLDIIWDKKPARKAPPVEPVLSPEQEFDKVLKELREGDEPRVDDSNRGDAEEKLTKKKGDNMNHYAVKFKLGKRKILREKINAKQISVYRQLLDMIEQRKPTNRWKNQKGYLQAYQKPLEVEREFLDAFAIIIESGYYLEQDDYMQLIDILKVQHQTELTGERIKIFQFFTKAAEMLEFDKELVTAALQGPWEEQAQSEQQLILSQAFILSKNSTRQENNGSIPLSDSLLHYDVMKRISLNQVSGFIENQDLANADSNVHTPAVAKESRCESQLPGSDLDGPMSPMTRFTIRESMATKSRAAKAEIMLQDDSIFDV